MLDVIAILIAREGVRAGIEEPRPERAPRRRRQSVATWLRTLADRLEGFEAEPAGR